MDRGEIKNMAAKRLLKKTLALFLIASFVLPYFLTAKAADTADYHNLGIKNWIVIDDNYLVAKVSFNDFEPVSKDVKLEEDGILIPVNGEIMFKINVPYDGKYIMAMEYAFLTNKVIKNTITIKYQGNELIAPAPALWEDATKEYILDRYGNEVVPEQQMVSDSHLEYICEYASLDKSPFKFDLKAGQNVFNFKNNTQDIKLKSIYLLKEKGTQSYIEYKNALKKYPEIKTDDTVIIEAEDYSLKSDSFIRSGNIQNPVLYPYETSKKLLNIIDGNSWKEVGQKVLWEFKIDNPGWYALGFRYSQGSKEGVPSFRTIEIDGNIPFKEMENYGFPYTGVGYKNLLLRDKEGKIYYIWLDKGIHTIALKADGGPLEKIVSKLKEIMLEINDTGIDLRKLTGGEPDVNRDWDIKKYMPDILDKLNGWSDELNGLYKDLEVISGENPVGAVNLVMASQNLKLLTQKPTKIPAQLSKLNEGSGSASQLIGDTITFLSNQPLSLDRIYITKMPEDLPPASVNFWKRLSEGTKRFFLSFNPNNKAYIVSASKESDALAVWVNRPIQYVETLQQLADSYFTPKTGIKVNLSVMPDEQKLVLANASHIAPDMALGISAHIPYNLAIRGAILDLTKFKDFLPYISKEYNLATLVPFYINGKIYATPETQQFYVLMYRKDILDKYRISIPNTWDEVEKMMPELYRHSANFFIPMAAWSGLKPFYTVAPFIFQNNGNIYRSDGLKVDINSENSIKGFNLMTELFTIYSVSENVPNFYNNFRYGIVPVGVADFGTYVTLMTAAPEIADAWDIALSPGVKDSSGNILRYQPAIDKVDAIFSSSDKQEEAWEFLKWWLSKDTQVKYAYALQTRYGPEYMWNSANMVAFEELPFPEQHKKVILEQWKWIKEVQSHPAGYMVEREISNAWTDVVMNGESVRIAVDKAALTSNREILRRLEEFGYIKDGKIVSVYHIPTEEDIRKMVSWGNGK